MKIFEKVMYLMYLLSAGMYLFDIIHSKDISKISALIWVFNAAMMFTLYRYTDRTLDAQMAWRDKLIEELFKDKQELIVEKCDIKEEAE